MKDRFILLVVGLVLFVQFLFFVGHNPYPHGDIVDVSYRQKERLAAFWDDTLHPSSDTHAKLAAELKQMHRYELVMMILNGGVLLAIDAFGIYYLMR